MTDWDRVERLRSKGWDWSAIAADPTVQYTAPEGAGDPGRALKALYFQRRSTRKGSNGADRKSSRASEEQEKQRAKSLRARAPFIGLLIAFAAGFWILFGRTVVTSLLVLVPLIYVAIALAFGLIVFGVGLVLGGRGISGGWRKAIAVSLVVALLVTGVGALAAYSTGIPNLSPNTTNQPGNGQGSWVSAGNPLWTSGGLPVFFFAGSIACPFCSASSWAMYGALSAFGTLGGVTFYHSNPGDTYPNTPEVDLSSVTYTSSYLSVQIAEGTDDSQITVPALTPIQNAYFQTYDGTGGVPFNVVGGIYIHTGSLVDPAILSPGGTALTTSQVQNDIASGSGSVYQAIYSAQIYLEAYFVKADQKAGINPPSAVLGDSAVMSIVAQISG